MTLNAKQVTQINHIFIYSAQPRIKIKCTYYLRGRQAAGVRTGILGRHSPRRLQTGKHNDTAGDVLVDANCPSAQPLPRLQPSPSFQSPTPPVSHHTPFIPSCSPCSLSIYCTLRMLPITPPPSCLLRSQPSPH